MLFGRESDCQDLIVKKRRRHPGFYSFAEEPMVLKHASVRELPGRGWGGELGDEVVCVIALDLLIEADLLTTGIS